VASVVKEEKQLIHFKTYPISNAFSNSEILIFFICKKTFVTLSTLDLLLLLSIL
jgi:hypothetical protein